jgi:PAS domain-containing protein
MTGQTKPDISNATAAEIVRHFGHWRNVAQEQPVFITHHGRSTHVLLDHDRYEKLIGDTDALTINPMRDSAASSTRDDPHQIAVADIIEWFSHGFAICDHELVVTAINRSACSLIGKSHAAICGQPLWTAAPALAGTLLQSYVEQTLRSGQPSNVDLPSVFRQGRWMRIEILPMGSGVGIMSRDITEEITHSRLADVKEAILKAMSLGSRVGYMRVNTMGAIERIDDTLCRSVGLIEGRLVGVGAQEIVVLAHRPRFREELARVITDGGTALLECDMMRNEDPPITVQIALAGLAGIYGSEGCIALVIANT